MDLTEVPEQDLRSELARREQARREEAERFQKELEQQWIALAPALVASGLFRHRKDCSDARPWGDRCERCILVVAATQQYWEAGARLTLSVELPRNV